jgi:hypothetical protein
MSNKIGKLVYWLVPILFVSLCPLTLVAQYGNAQEKQGKKPDKAAQSQSVTGCLQKGDKAGEFSITGEDGKTWGLRSSTVKLDEHLGHKVTVTGASSHESKAEEKKEGQVEKASSKEEYGDLDVSSLKMVSATCSK